MPETRKQKFTLRHDSWNGHHARMTLFANGANCGNLTMRTDEWIVFCAALMQADAAIDRFEITYTAAFDLRSEDIQVAREVLPDDVPYPAPLRFFPDAEGSDA